jgi:predicted outer membrane protein
MSPASRFGLASILLLAAGALGCAGTGGPPLESLGQREFLEEAGRRSAAEARLGREAQVERPEVRAFVERTVQDHARIEREAREALREVHTETPPEAALAQGADTAIAGTAHEGCHFEADYLYCVISDHEALVTAYEERSRSGEHPAVTAFAERNAPVLERRLEEARALLIQVVSTRAQPFMPPPTYPAARFMIGGR